MLCHQDSDPHRRRAMQCPLANNAGRSQAQGLPSVILARVPAKVQSRGRQLLLGPPKSPYLPIACLCHQAALGVAQSTFWHHETHHLPLSSYTVSLPRPRGLRQIAHSLDMPPTSLQSTNQQISSTTNIILALITLLVFGTCPRRQAWQKEGLASYGLQPNPKVKVAHRAYLDRSTRHSTPKVP